MKHQSRQENIAYLVAWGLLLAAPLLSLYLRSISDPDVTFEWAKVLVLWPKFAVYLLLFLIHNILLAPLLLYGRKRMVYGCMLAVIIAAFSLYQCNSRPPIVKHVGEKPSAECRERPKPPHGEHLMPPPFVGERDIMAIVVLILMLGGNLGVKYYFKTRNDQKRMLELEKQNLEQQLEYLRYQINPHFFMNTLNNIHALVDIEPEKAKDTIVELSKMMRFVLYDGNKQHVPLSLELDFIRHYISLMQLRYTEKVKITLDLPQVAPDYKIPPLILITFIENAFKHGVSYRQESFIEVKAAIDRGRLLFTCRNSKVETLNEEKGGVGLTNVRKRLILLYGHNYSLNIGNTQDVYSVELNIPLS